MKPILETKRLILQEITIHDKVELFQLHSNPEVQRYTGEPPVTTMKEIEQAIQGRKEHYQTYGYGRWAVYLKDTEAFVGWAGLAYLPEFDEVDLGYRFLPEFWGKGIATEVSEAILNYGFEVLKLKKIVAIAMKEHKASLRVMEKVGMEFYKIAPYEEGSEDAVWYVMWG